MSNGASDERARSPVFRLADFAEWVDLGRGRRWDRDEAISNINQNDAIERITSVYVVATAMRTEAKHGIEDYERKMVVEDVTFVQADEALEWANDELDCDYRVVEVSLKGQL